ncbi:MAG: AMP-binding protein, partial [Rhodospirillaceae bacterium]|nr:AMP-binding protein [Rhodospirillaceae bacterium]
MPFATIVKTPEVSGPAPRMSDYGQARAGFSWADARGQLAGLPGGGLNIGFEAVDRHVLAGTGDKLALRWLGKDGRTEDYTYVRLRDETNRFASLLAKLGVTPGERVFTLLGRQPALYIAALGTLKAGCVFSPLFSAFGPEPIETRMTKGDGRVLVTTEALYRKKVAPVRERLPGLRHVLLVGERTAQAPAGSLDLA